MFRFRSFLALLAALPVAAHAQRADVLIRGGTVYDGSGGAPRVTDVAIRGDRIVLVGSARGWTAARTINARGLIVAPGFIDPHIHATEDLTSRDRADRQAGYALMQGITTAITGNDGHGTFEIARTLDQMRRDSIGTNAVLLAGHGAIRRAVLGAAAREPTPAELDSMKALLSRAMREGAFGLSSGLYYAPGNFAKTDEVIALARVAAAHGGLYDSHTRDESSYSIGLLASVQEALDIGRGANIPVNISHIKALGVDVWGKAPDVIALVRKAQAEGVRVTADQYPWTASGTGVSAALLPRWAEAGGRDSMVARLKDPATRARIAVEMRDNMRRRGGAASLLITSISSGVDSSALGKTLEQYAKLKGVDPVDAAIEIMLAGRAGLASFNMNEADIEAFMKEPWVLTGSDGSGGHPRKYGTYPRKIRRYVLDKPVITMQRMIQSSSAQVAETFGIEQRGYLRDGFFADVVVFDPRTIRDVATYVEPAKLATGMRWVFVNGVAAVANGKLTGAMAGRPLAKASRMQTAQSVMSLTSVQYRSPAGVDYRAQADTGPIANAESAVIADPRNVQRLIQLGVAQSGARQYREAIETFTRGLAIAPNEPMLYRWRGHRHLSVRELDKAMADLMKGYQLDSTNYGILYHLGIVRFARGDFNGAADAFARAQPRAPDAGELAGATDWLWMSLMRAGRATEAQAMLARRPDSLATTNAYAQRLKLYRGQIRPDEVLATAADTSDIGVATLSYGVGNWYLVRGDTAAAKTWFERSIRSGGWPAFGFIISEVELQRLR